MQPPLRSSMHSNLRALFAILAASALAFLGPTIALGQGDRQGELPAARDRNETISSLQVGRQLEAERRWQEAIQYYEKAIKRESDNRQLADRLKISRVHVDVIRRYSDRTFLETVQRSDPVDAMDVLGEVLAKLDAYYVEPIDYYKLGLYGTACLEVALTEQDFLQTHLAHIPANTVENFRRQVHQSIAGKRVSSASDLRALVAQIAAQAQQQIGLKPSATIYEYIAGSVAMLDPYSAFLTPGEYREIMSQIEGNLIGLGVELWAEGTELRIVDVFKGSPAFDAGLQPGHHILEVDGYSVLQVGAKKAADMLRGPEGSRVQLVIHHGEDQNTAIEVVRKRVDIPSVSVAELREGGVGYIRITNFQKTTVHEVKRSMFQLSREGMKSVVIDLRRNPGGLLDAAVELADEFLSQGGIVSTRGRNGQENHNFTARTPGTWEIPLVVLIDGDSASASEIFAGAIRDHNRGYVVGQTSYGKGSVQGVFHNERGNGGMRLTVSKFYSPNGSAISSRGIIPHVVVPEEPATEPQSLISLRPNADSQKWVAHVGPSQDPAAPAALTAQRPNLDAASAGADSSARRDPTLEKGLQIARTIQNR